MIDILALPKSRKRRASSAPFVGFPETVPCGLKSLSQHNDMMFE
jgi:hypothetical protein